MRTIALSAALLGSIVLSYADTSSAAQPAVACPLLTQAQIGAAIGGTANAGEPIVIPTSCQWTGQQGKRVTLTINRVRANRSPVEQFNAAKTTVVPGITVEPVSGVGDDAYYVYYSGQNRLGCGLAVKKGNSAFEIRVYGFDLAQAKTVAKTLAQEAAAKF